MLNITPLCKKYNKLPGHFKDNPRIVSRPDFKDIKITYGQGGKTEIPDTMAAEFYIWLSEDTRQQILSGVLWENIKVI